MTIRAVAASVGVPESTVRLYREEFDEFIEGMGEGRRRRLTEEGAATLKRVVAWKREGWPSVQVRDVLSRERQPRERARSRTVEERLDVLIALGRTQEKEVALLRVQVGALRDEVAGLQAALEQDAPPRFEDVMSAAWIAERKTGDSSS